MKIWPKRWVESREWCFGCPASLGWQEQDTGFEVIRFGVIEGVAHAPLNKLPLHVLDIATMQEIDTALEELNGEPSAKGLTLGVY